jgi:benzaldehyde dehydrogenase (NAD)
VRERGDPEGERDCPRTHSLIVEAFLEAGFPAGTVSIVNNAPEDAGDVVGALIDAPQVRRINVTGSARVGKIIAKRAAEHLKPVLFELGGKAPLVVLEGADLDETVKEAAFGAFMNSGQLCISTEGSSWSTRSRRNSRRSSGRR